MEAGSMYTAGTFSFIVTMNSNHKRPWPSPVKCLEKMHVNDLARYKYNPDELDHQQANITFNSWLEFTDVHLFHYVSNFWSDMNGNSLSPLLTASFTPPRSNSSYRIVSLTPTCSVCQSRRASSIPNRAMQPLQKPVDPHAASEPFRRYSTRDQEPLLGRGVTPSVRHIRL